ncbi:hypothetical protein H072_5123 [Dactylellina haptotyla CBS 200.50]|uniref:Zn(2)-C6 fungal-type domain-containing protein n=1 Tax=Dactylellina haptotyla (strain CBS 200.50) TaxID=1284197 RepID=S8C067_DACHA|nr:hypothetical protein H072_5123 [Dactylellina haptotyla CBS 200.50]
MQNVTFVPSEPFTNSNQKNYVFVDEQNRHKRLKVMRACEGCRRRKIKCDAATTNTWPCSACKRLKLTCVPPTMHFDKGGFQTQGMDFGDDDGHSSEGEEESYLPPQAQMQTQSFLRRSTSTGSLPHYGGRDHFGVRQASQLQVAPQTAFMPSLYTNPHAAAPLPVDTSVDFNPNNLYTTPPPGLPPQIPGTDASHASWRSESPVATFNTAGVQEVLGQLKIEDTGVASYIHSQSREIAARPALDESLEDYELHPIFNPGIHDYAVRIPQEEMPSDDEAEALFHIFFSDVHPYLPVVNKNAFYRQWHGSRNSISPLLLEAILACAGRISNNPKVGLKWLGMASKHLDCFFDVPRISTIQALLLLLKARESAPQRGYFFRSYISIVTMMAMARDLGLDKHAELHKNGTDCLDGPIECLTKTKVWQACFMLEFMVCAPQGRHIMASDPATIDIPASSSVFDMTEKELTIHMNFSYFVELLKLIRRINDVFARLKTSSNWAGDPEFLQCGPSFDNWLYALPPHLQIDVPLDLHMPMEPLLSHYAGNLLIYGYLARIMFHRPALAFARNFTATGQWRMHLRACYDSSRKACRLTEAVIDQYGIRGLQCMLRGINFTIYAMLTCTMVNLVAATCPDSEFNSDARDYFARTMRVLEVCIDISASMETRAQIEALRAAFSQDITQPFVLNSNFPFYSSPSAHQSSPAASIGSYSPVDVTRSPLSSSLSAPINTSRNVTISPPTSERGESPNPSLIMMQQVPQVAQPTPRKSHHSGQPEAGWNPQRIFEHWSNGFPGLASAPLPPSTLPTVPENGLVEGMMPTASAYFQPNIPVVSPDVWQNTVAHVFAGTKRSWQYANQ